MTIAIVVAVELIRHVILLDKLLALELRGCAYLLGDATGLDSYGKVNTHHSHLNARLPSFFGFAVPFLALGFVGAAAGSSRSAASSIITRASFFA